jgi:hypothetical protein
MVKNLQTTRCFLLFIAFLTLTQLHLRAQIAVGDYGSAGSLAWDAPASWKVCVTAGTFTGATTATTIPDANTNVWIQGSNQVTVATAGSVFKTLHLCYGGSSNILVSGSGSLDATGVGTTVYFEGNSSITLVANVFKNNTVANLIQNRTSATAYVILATTPALTISKSLSITGARLTTSTTNLIVNSGVTITIGRNLTASPQAAISNAPIYPLLSADATSFVNVIYNLADGTVTAPMGAEVPSANPMVSRVNVTINISTGGSNTAINPSSSTRAVGDLTLTSGTLDLVTSNRGLIINGTVTRTNGTITANSGTPTVQFKNQSPFTIPTGLFVGNTIMKLTVNGTDAAGTTGVPLTLGEPLTVGSTLTFITTNGLGNHLFLGNYDLTLATGATVVNGFTNRFIVTDGTGKLILPVISGFTGLLLFPIGKSGTYQPITIDYTGATTASGTLSAKFNPTNPGLTGITAVTDAGITMDGVSPSGFWNVENSTALGGTYTATVGANGFKLTDGVTTITDFANIRLVKRSSGGSWANSGGTSAAPVDLTAVAISGLSTFSDFGIGGAPGSVLSVDLQSFTAKQNGASNHLYWSTVSEKSNAQFNIERSQDGQNFITIGTVKGNGTTTIQSDYFFTDEGPLSINYYRLRQIDFNGTENVSKIVAVIRENKANRLKLYPSISSDFLTLETQSEGQLSVSDATGRIVLSQKIESFGQGDTKTQVVVNQLISGLYFLVFQNKEGGQLVGKFVKQ